MENEELAKVLNDEGLDSNAKVEAVQKFINSNYVPANVLADERKKFKTEKEGLETNYKKPILPSEEELAENSRSKSAKLRVFERK